ncbi:MAG: hypothetical protein AB1503_02990 [Bacillota bacterium]
MKAEAERILEETQLLSILAPHGEARVVGSVALDLVVKRDIDVHLLVAEGTDLFDVACSVCRKLFGQGNVHELRITPYPEKGSVKVAVDHEFAHLRGRCPKGVRTPEEFGEFLSCQGTR